MAKEVICEHDWVRLNGMTTHRENDRTFYCMAGHHWCRLCGSILKTTQPGPYEHSVDEVIEPEGKSPATIEFDDWDNVDDEPKTFDCELPQVINSISVSHDGGRLDITVNDIEIFNSLSLDLDTRDCSIEIIREKS